MVETRSIAAMAATNEAIASLRATSDHHSKNIQEIQKIQEIHTRTMNEMNQHLMAILQKLGSDETRPQSSHEPLSPIHNSSTVSFAKPVKLDFPRFSCEDPASWVYKANQYFGYYQTPAAERLMVASFHMDQEAPIWFQDAKEAGVFCNWEGMV